MRIYQSSYASLSTATTVGIGWYYRLTWLDIPIRTVWNGPYESEDLIIKAIKELCDLKDIDSIEMYHKNT